MDLDKLVEDGARAICVEMGNDPDEDVSMSFDPTTPKPMWECFTNEARAVLAIALAAAAERARARADAFADRDALFDRGACTALTDYADSLFSAATQLGAANG